MAVIEQDVVFTTKDADGNTVIQMPITRAENIENVMSIEQGGTGAENVAEARTNLGLATAVTDASISGKVITLTFADGTTKMLTTQDTVYGSIYTTLWRCSGTTPTYANTDFALSQAFTNFKQLIVIFSENDNATDERNATTWDTKVLDACLKGTDLDGTALWSGDGYTYFVRDYAIYWTVASYASGSSTTLLKFRNEKEIAIFAIIGVN